MRGGSGPQCQTESVATNVGPGVEMITLEFGNMITTTYRKPRMSKLLEDAGDRRMSCGLCGLGARTSFLLSAGGAKFVEFRVNRKDQLCFIR